MSLPRLPSLSVLILFAVCQSIAAQTPSPAGSPATSSSWAVWLGPGSVSALIALLSLIYAYRKDKKAGASQQQAEESQKQAEESQKQAEESQKQAEREKARADALETRLFYKAGKIRWTIDVIDLDGTVNIECAFEGIEVLPRGASLTGLPGFLGFAPPGASITQYPKKTYHSFTPTNLGREVKLTVFEPRKPNSYEYICNITGGLPKGHRLSFTYKATAANGIFMSKEDVDQYVQAAFKKEYWAHYVTTPADVLEIAITFPTNYVIERFYLGVCVGRIATDAQMYGEEIRRIEDSGGFQPTSDGVRLRVDKPFVGLTYLIYWNPPPKRVVDALR